MGRKDLPLERKVYAIRQVESGKSSRNVADQLGVGKTQINNIVKRKREYLEAFENHNQAPERCRKLRKTGNEKLNEMMYEWFKIARSKNLPISGPILQAKARSFAEELGGGATPSFTASNGWLECFRKRHNIVARVMSGKSADVDITVTSDWKGRLAHICEGYKPEDIWNMDQTGLYFKALPDRTLTQKTETCREGKRAKERLTLSLCCSLTGEKDKPLLIGKSYRPRCFKNLDVNKLPVTWRSNKSAWMTSPTFEDWLKGLNSQMKMQERKILLFLDNATCHPALKLSHIKLQFFPPDTTSKLQPLDQGIIKAVKSRYRKKLLHHLIGHMDSVETTTDLSRKINVLDAAYWIDEAWRETSPTTIQKCFAASGFGDESCKDKQTQDKQEAGPSTGKPQVDEEADILTKQVSKQLGEDVEWQKFLTVDDEVATHNTAEEDWEGQLVSKFVGAKANNASETKVDDDSDDEMPPNSTPCEKISLQQVLKNLEIVKAYALQQGDIDCLNMSVMSLRDHLVRKHAMAKRNRQTTINEFFAPK